MAQECSILPFQNNEKTEPPSGNTGTKEADWLGNFQHQQIILFCNSLRLELKINKRIYIQNSLCNWSVVLSVLSPNLDGLHTQLSTLFKLSFLKVHGWRQKAYMYICDSLKKKNKIKKKIGI